LVVVVFVVVILFFAAVNPPRVLAVPSYARQTGLACSGCHYAPPELNPAGRRFKLTGYVDRADETKVIKTDPGKKRAALDLLASLPLSVMLETSFTSTKSPLPTSQNGSIELPQDISLFLSGASTSNVGSFLQVTYDTQNDRFTSDNTDIRYANKTKMGGKELIYGLDLNNNPTVEDLWNSTPAWGFPWINSDFAPTPTAHALINGGLAQDVAGVGGFAMWDNHLYLDAALYRSEHVGGPQPNPGDGSTNNIRGLAPYWRVAWQQLTAKTQYEFGTYGMHVRNSAFSGPGPEDEYTDFAVDTQIDRTLFRTDVLSFRGTFIHENSDLLASFAAGAAGQGSHHLKKRGMDISRADASVLATQANQALFQRFHKGGQSMPAFSHLSEPEIRSLLAYLKQIAGFPGAERAQIAVDESPFRVGEHIVKSTCHICHSAVGANPNAQQISDGTIPPLSTLTRRTTMPEFVRKVTSGAPIIMGSPAAPCRGRMPVFDYLSEDEAADVYLYLSLYPPR
jgi:mono/diheme cytochrome c family protein